MISFCKIIIIGRLCSYLIIKICCICVQFKVNKLNIIAEISKDTVFNCIIKYLAWFVNDKTIPLKVRILTTNATL